MYALIPQKLGVQLNDLKNGANAIDSSFGKHKCAEIHGTNGNVDKNRSSV